MLIGCLDVLIGCFVVLAIHARNATRIHNCFTDFIYCGVDTSHLAPRTGHVRTVWSLVSLVWSLYTDRLLLRPSYFHTVWSLVSLVWSLYTRPSLLRPSYRPTVSPPPSTCVQLLDGWKGPVMGETWDPTALEEVNNLFT